SFSMVLRSQASRTAKASTDGGAPGADDRSADLNAKSHRAASVIAPQQPSELALDLDFFGPIDLGVVGAVGRIEADHAVLAVQVLESCPLVPNQRDHDLAAPRSFSAPDEGGDTREEPAPGLA